MVVHVNFVELDVENRVYQMEPTEQSLFEVKQVVAYDRQDNKSD